MIHHDDLCGVFAGAPVGILVADLESTNFLAANPAICRMLGYSESELLRLGVGDICLPEHLAFVAALFDALARREVARTLDYPCLRKDRSPFHADVSAALIPFAGRQAVAGFFLDNSERRQAEAEREKLEAHSRELQKAESLARMAGAVAHHFNNRLQAVMGMLELALDDLPRDANVVGTLNAAMASAREATKVSSSMLAYLGQIPGKREPLDLAEACRQHLPSLRVAMPTKVILDTELPSPGPVIHANTDQIRQLLSNLVTNAWEAVGDVPGCVRVTVGTVAPTRIPTAHCAPGEWPLQHLTYACLKVTDSGCGIPRHVRATLFDPFASSKFAGRGLGLPVVKGIAKAHGGVITVESEPGAGTTFGVYLPTLAVAAHPHPVASRVPGPPPSRALALATANGEPVPSYRCGA